MTTCNVLARASTTCEVIWRLLAMYVSEVIQVTAKFVVTVVVVVFFPRGQLLHAQSRRDSDLQLDTQLL